MNTIVKVLNKLNDTVETAVSSVNNRGDLVVDVTLIDGRSCEVNMTKHHCFVCGSGRTRMVPGQRWTKNRLTKLQTQIVELAV